MSKLTNSIKCEDIVPHLLKDDWPALNELFKKCSQMQHISATVSQLPESAIVPFVVYLRENSPYRLDDFPDYTSWLHQILLHHYNTLKALPLEQRHTLLSPLHRCNKENAAALPKVYQWKARQDHFFRKGKQLRETAAEAGPSGSSGARVLFHKNEDSSDDEDLAGASTVGASESEENWDELSEAAQGSSDEDSDARLGGHDGNVSMQSSSRGDSDIIDVESESDMEEDGDEDAPHLDGDTSDRRHSGNSDDDTASGDDTSDDEPYLESAE